MKTADIDKRTLPFLPHPSAIKALTALSDFREREAGRDRPRCLHIVAASGMGKSRLLKHYVGQLACDSGMQGAQAKDVISVELPADGCYRELARMIVNACLPGYPLSRTPRLLLLAQDALRNACVRQLVLDEAGHTLHTGKVGLQRLLGFLKSISNMGITIAIATTAQMANAVAADEQLRSRFVRIDLPVWQESRELRQFLVGIEEVLPFSRRSHLDSRTFVRWFVVNQCLLTDHLIGVICEAAGMALREKQPCITPDLLDKAWAIYRLREAV